MSFDAVKGGEEPYWEAEFDDNFRSSPGLVGEHRQGTGQDLAFQAGDLPSPQGDALPPLDPQLDRVAERSDPPHRDPRVPR